MKKLEVDNILCRFVPVEQKRHKKHENDQWRLLWQSLVTQSGHLLSLQEFDLALKGIYFKVKLNFTLKKYYITQG